MRLVPDEVLAVAVLFRDAVHLGNDAEVRRILDELLRHDERPERRAAVAALAGEPVGTLELGAQWAAAGAAAVADVEHDAVAEDVVVRLCLRDVQRLLAD